MSNQPAHKHSKDERPVDVSIKNSSKSLGILERKWLVALVFSIFFGWMGLDAFYLGKTGKGVLKLLTFGLFGILWIIDIIMIATKSVGGIVWKERNPRKSWVSEYYPVIIVLVIVFFGVIGIASSGSQNSSSSNGGSSKSSSKGGAKTYRFAGRADKQQSDIEVLPNEPSTIDGVKMTVTNIKYATSLDEFTTADSGKTYLVADVQLENTSKKTQPYNEVDFRVQTAGGQVLDGDFATVPNPLNSGDLVAGGKASGQVVFQVPVETGHEYMIWKPGLESTRAIIQTQ